jgi:hypothetical protein
MVFKTETASEIQIVAIRGASEDLLGRTFSRVTLLALALICAAACSCSLVS